MPTGYTHDIAKGITFEQFVWQCARGMGALIMMRDEDTDAPIPERYEPSDYHVKEIATATARLAYLEAMTDEQAALGASDDFRAAMDRHRGHVQEKHDLRAKYQTMLNKVRGWKSPSPDHDGFKKFMDEQISSSIDFDCSLNYMTPPIRLNGFAWKDGQIAEAKRSLEYHTTENAKEIERTEGRNKWLRDLRASVPIPHPELGP